MSRFDTVNIPEATGPAAALFTAIKGAVGKVPNAYAAVGSNSPVALAAALALDSTITKTALDKKEVEVIKLVASQESQCDYCLAAHTLMGQKAGLTRSAILAYRHEQPSGDERLDALAHFVRILVSTRGTVPIEALANVRRAGYSDAQIMDTFLVISSITFTNLVNRVNDTVLDFPKAD